MLKVTEVNVFPVKSLRGISVGSAVPDRCGFEHDRRWMLVDTDGRFITQRQYAQLALIETRLRTDGISLRVQDRKVLEIPLQPEQTGRRIEVRVWNDRVSAVVADEKINQWFSDYLGVACQLVAMPRDGVRAVDPDYAVSPQDQVSFADGFPFLLIGEASLRDLNRRLLQRGESAVPMIRFRPNIVVDTEQAFVEDRWKKIRIGELIFHLVKPCSRCVIPTIDLQTAARHQEPLRTLLEYRKQGNKAYFGQNLVHEFVPGAVVSVGDRVEVLE